MSETRTLGSDARSPAALLFVAALALGVALRLSHFWSEIGGPHTFRQSHVVSDIISLAHDPEGGPRLQALERYDYSWAPGQRIFDIPIYQALAAKLCDLTGMSALMSARALSIAIFVALCFLLRRLARPLCGELGAALSVLVFAISALSMQWFGAPMPDNLAVLLSLGSLAAYLQSERLATPMFALSLVLAVLATLIKPPVHLPVVLALGGESLLRQGSGALRDRKLLAHGAFALLALVVFELIAHKLNSGTDKESSLSWFFGTLSQRLEVARWTAFARRLGSVFGHPLLFVPFAWAAFSLARNVVQGRATAAQRLAFCLLLGNAVSGLIFFNVYTIHNYYQLPLLPVYALLVAFGVGSCVEQLPRLRALATRYFPVTVALALLFVAHAVQFAYWLPTLNYGGNRDLVQLGRQLQRATPPDAQVLVVMRTFVEGPEMMYYARRRGRAIAAEELNDAALSSFVRHAGPQRWVAFTSDTDQATIAGALAKLCDYDLVPAGTPEPRTYRVEPASASAKDQCHARAASGGR